MDLKWEFNRRVLQIVPVFRAHSHLLVHYRGFEGFWSRASTVQNPRTVQPPYKRSDWPNSRVVNSFIAGFEHQILVVCAAENILDNAKSPNQPRQSQKNLGECPGRGITKAPSLGSPQVFPKLLPAVMWCLGIIYSRRTLSLPKSLEHASGLPKRIGY